MRAAAFYRALLRCYPAAFRQEYGDEMSTMFTDQLGEARRSGRRLHQAALWLSAASDAFTIAPREHGYVILQDLRYALRTMAARPGFTAVAILSLALGIGANTAIFSLWNGVLRAPLPAVQHPEQLVILTDPGESGSWRGRWDGRTDGPRAWLSYGEFEQLRSHSELFSGLMASQSSLDTFDIRVDGAQAERARGRLVSGAFFEVLGIPPALGSLFTRRDERIAAPNAVISHSYWQRRFAGRADVLGKTIVLAKTAFTIIGVTPPGFIGETAGQQPDLWLPLLLQQRVEPGRDLLHDTPPGKAMWLHAFGRLQPGVTLAQAQAQTNAIFAAGLEAFYGATATGPRRSEYLNQTLRLQPAGLGASPSRKEFSTSLNALLAAVGVLLLIACANLANLLLARGASRKPEMALRLSLGASRGRLIRQLITESLVLAAMGAVAAIAVAFVLHEWLVRMMTESDARFQMTFALNPAVSVFLLVTTLLAVLVFGVLPAWQVTNTTASASLKQRSHGALGQMRSGRALVALQLALSLPLLCCAGLLVRTFYNLRHADLGFPTERLSLVRVDLSEANRDASRRETLIRELHTRLAQIPGVNTVSYSQLGIFSGGESSTSIEVEGYVVTGDHDRGSAVDAVGPGYFSTLGIPMRLGHDILDTDRAGAARVCVINDAFAKRFFEGRNPIGMRITAVDENVRTSYQVVGVAGNAKTKLLRTNVQPRFFVPSQQAPASNRSPTFLIRAATESVPVLSAARKIISQMDDSLPILTAGSLEKEMEWLIALERATAQLALVFACVALTLAGIGLYGVLSYGIARRTGEFAIRIALGAPPACVIGMVLRETSTLILAGLAAGGGLSYAASLWIDSKLYGIAPQDPFNLTASATVLLLAAFLAVYLPARRASRLHPMAALRQE